MLFNVILMWFWCCVLWCWWYWMLFDVDVIWYSFDMLLMLRWCSFMWFWCLRISMLIPCWCYG